MKCLLKGIVLDQDSAQGACNPKSDPLPPGSMRRWRTCPCPQLPQSGPITRVPDLPPSAEGV